MNLVTLAQSAKDAYRVLDRRFADLYRLETALQRGIFLDVLPVLVQRRGANHVQLAAREHGFQHVGGVHRTFGRARTDDGVQLVDEEHDLPLSVGDLLQDRFQPFLELAAILCTGDEGAHVERNNPFVLQPLRHIVANDALRESFHDGSLADAGLADEHGVVLGAPGEHLDHPADLFVAADDGIELALSCQLRQIPAVALERLVGRFRVLTRHPLRPADRGQRLENRVSGDAALLEDSRGGRAPSLRRDGDEQVLGADVLVLQPLRFLFGGVRHFAQPCGESNLRATVRTRQTFQLTAHLAGQRGRVGIHLPDDLRDDPVLLLEEREQQVLGQNLGVTFAIGQLLRREDRLLALLSVFVDIHNSFQLPASSFSSSFQLPAKRFFLRSRLHLRQRLVMLPLVRR